MEAKQMDQQNEQQTDKLTLVVVVYQHYHLTTYHKPHLSPLHKQAVAPWLQETF